MSGNAKTVIATCKYCDHFKDGNACPVAIAFMQAEKSKVIKGFHCAAFKPWVGTSLAHGVEDADVVKNQVSLDGLRADLAAARKWAKLWKMQATGERIQKEQCIDALADVTHERNKLLDQQVVSRVNINSAHKEIERLNLIINGPDEKPQSEKCPHGGEWGECDECDFESDRAYDTAREDKMFGR